MKSKYILNLIIGMFILMGIGGVLGVNCNADLSSANGTTCNLAGSLTLNGTYTIYLNGTTSSSCPCG